jgi:glucoamylase
LYVRSAIKLELDSRVTDFYTWTRDSALTLKMIVDEFILGNTSLQMYIEDYITAQAKLQTVTNPSGSLQPDLAGLGEPKFEANGTAFTGSWGRPQRDGPALRAIALMEYSNWLIGQGQASRVQSTIWPVISNDLNYVGMYWQSNTFDLWEEVNGASFFTTQNQYRSLVEGAALASKLGVRCIGCSAASDVLCFLQSYWNGKYFTANVNVNDGRTGIDANTMLGSIAVFDVNATCNNPSFQPCHSKSLASFKVFVDSFRNLYTINAGISRNSGVALGRYQEDVYMGGNPWYLITLGAAEFLYDAIAQWNTQGTITVDSTSLAFFQDLIPSTQVMTYRASSGCQFAQIVKATTAYADSFVSVAQKYTPSNGSLSEQFLKSPPGTPLSAYDLTWSFASFVTMAQRRAGQYPASWAGGVSDTLPAQCPNGTTCASNVLFVVNATTYYGENIFVSGNVTQLGNWNINSAHPLSASNYTSDRPEWYAQVAFKGGETVSYVYVRQENCGQPYLWESVNRTITVPPCSFDPGAIALETNDAWVGSVGQNGNC